MRIDEALTARRQAVLDRWFEAVLATYPEDTARFMAGVGDPFANPVGHTLREGLGRLLDAFLAEAPPAVLASAIDGIVRIRAVQELAPSEAVGFVHDLRGILRVELAGVDEAGRAALDAGVDRLALVAFDTYMRCREKLFEIRVREIRESQALAARVGARAAALVGSQQRGEGA